MSGLGTFLHTGLQGRFQIFCIRVSQLRVTTSTLSLECFPFVLILFHVSYLYRIDFFSVQRFQMTASSGSFEFVALVIVVHVYRFCQATDKKYLCNNTPNRNLFTPQSRFSNHLPTKPGVVESSRVYVGDTVFKNS